MTEITLAIDTSTRVAVGLARDEQVLRRALVGDDRSHVELLTPTIHEVLASTGMSLADVTRIGVGVGPGPFTGLRVGVATAEILGQALGIPVIGVCSLDAIALCNAAASGEFVVVIDARRHEVYWARYDATGLRVDGPHVTAASALPPLPAIGPGAPDAAGEGFDAGAMAADLDLLPHLGLEPLYLRDPDAATATTRKSAIAGGRLRLPIGVKPS